MRNPRLNDRKDLDHLPGAVTCWSSGRGPGSRSALALTGYMYQFDDGTITVDEYDSLRTDAIEDELAILHHELDDQLAYLESLTQHASR